MWPLAICISSTHRTPRLPSLVFFLYTAIAYLHSRALPPTSKFNDLSSWDWERQLSLSGRDTPRLTLQTYIRSKASRLNTHHRWEPGILSISHCLDQQNPMQVMLQCHWYLPQTQFEVIDGPENLRWMRYGWCQNHTSEPKGSPCRYHQIGLDDQLWHGKCLWLWHTNKDGFWSIRAEDHDVGVCGEFDVVLFMAQIISGIIHLKHFVLIELTSMELNLSSLCIWEGAIITIIFMM